MLNWESLIFGLVLWAILIGTIILLLKLIIKGFLNLTKIRF